MKKPFDFYDIQRIGLEHGVAFNKNISWWDAGSEFKAKIREHLNIPLGLDCHDYHYSCKVSEQCALSKKLSGLDLINSEAVGVSLFPNGSLALLNVDTLNSKIAELQAEKYADKTGIEVYKAARESDAKTNARFEEIARTIADMRVREAQTAGKIDLVAATANQGIATNSAAIACLQNTVSSITKVVVPNSSCCPGWGDVTITPTASTTTTGG